MELTYYTDYALRVLVYAGLHENKLCLISEIADHYGISENHLMKVVHGLAQGGFVRTYRGRGGGLTLAKDPKEIVIGAVVGYMEGPFKPVECFRPGHWCAIAGACILPGMLDEAFRAFIEVLNRYTLADILERRRHLARRLLAPASPRKRGARKISRPLATT
ncbi:MAG TPA: Rrf2 family transcriptional regulator [Candidatus Binataceae bacterium]|nr:Rrf2 family transcriptional regulator [Candidatus Binataceae bacterium]